MRLTTVILLGTMLHLSAATFGQKLNYVNKNVSLEQLFKEIKKQTNYNVVWYEGKLNTTRTIDANFSNAPLDQVMDKALIGLPLTYTIRQNNIVIKEKTPSIIDKISNILQGLSKDINIRGKVTDENKKPLKGATIKIKNTTRSVITDEDGNFYIDKVQEKAILVISYLGYKTIEKEASESLNTIQLAESLRELTEVQVISTGYQNIPKERATGSFVQPDKEMYDARVAPDVLSKLVGITSGLLFNSGIAGPDPSNLNISIRGRSTIYSNDQPLIVVDNFPYNGNINDLNPQDVESITILKDAAAASIWGVKAGNGVIVISTKKGRVNQHTRISASTNLTVGGKPNLKYDENFLSSSDYIDIQQFLFRNGRYDGDLLDMVNYPSIPAAVEIMSSKRNGTISKQDSIDKIGLLKNIDIRDGLSKYYYTNPINQQYAFNISSGSQKNSNYFSSGYDKIQSNQKSVYSDRITLNFANMYVPIKNWEITTQLNYVLGNNRSNNPLTLSSATGVQGTYYPYTSFANANGNPLSINGGYSNEYKMQALQKNFLSYDYTPLAEFGFNKTTGKTTDSRISTGLKYSFLEEFSIETKYQYQNYKNESTNLQGMETYTIRDLINQYSKFDGSTVTGYNIPLGDLLGLGNSNTTTNNFRVQVNYDKTGKHALHALAGFEINQILNTTSSNLLYGYNKETDSATPVDYINYFILNPFGYGASIPSGIGITHNTDRFRSFYTTAAYTYDGRLTVSGSARRDGSNYFGVSTNQKTVPLWSIGGKWSIDHESFYNIPWLPMLSLRTTYGYNGNLNRNVTGLTTFKYETSALYTNLPYAIISNIGNPELRWEKNAILNLGIDFETRNSRIAGSLEYFSKHGVDLIGDQILAPSVGYINPNTGTNVLTGNFAGMRGNGVDILLTTINTMGKLQWTTNFNFSYVKDKVTKYDQGTTTNFSSFPTSGFSILPNLGKPVYALYSYKFAGLDHNTGDPQGYIDGNTISTNYSTLINPKSIGELIYNGPSRPPFFGGISNHLAYKNISLSFNITYKLGYYFRRPTINYANLFAASGGANVDFSLRWQNPGDELRTTIPSMIYPANSARDRFYSFSDVTVEKGDNIRLQDISLSYNFQHLTNRLKIKKLQVFAYAMNMGILWRSNSKGIDPDFPSGGIPYSRTISIGLKTEL